MQPGIRGVARRMLSLSVNMRGMVCWPEVQLPIHGIRRGVEVRSPMSSSKKRTHWYVFLMQVLIIAGLATWSSRQAAATEEGDPPSRAARLSFLKGQVSFQPAGESEWAEAIANRPLTVGDRLWTDTGARAELSTGSVTIRLGASTDLTFLNLDDRILQMQLTQGTVLVRVQRLRGDELVEVDTPNQAFSILRTGSYRIEAGENGASTLVTVRTGEGEASGGGDTYTVRSGQSTRFTGTDHLDATDLQSSRLDELDQWSQSRDRRADGSASARHVSHDVVGYEDLDDNGTWRVDPSYGDVWTPIRVTAGWAPYHYGHWAWISPWGYTWVDDAPWGYAPFHYGRWVTIGGRWGWVPGPVEVEAVYAPALVAFIGGPSFSLSISVGGAEVGWFPLGPREVYMPGYHVSRGYVERVNVSNTRVSNTTITNVYNTQVTNEYRTTNITYVNRTAPGGVTVVPRQAFAGAQPVARAAVKVDVQRIAAAPIGTTAAAAPTRSAVFGTAKVQGAPKPPAAVASRAVVAKAPPPPPPVPFAQQQRALEAHPGQPLARQEVESVRPPAAAGAQPLVKQAPPGKPAVARGDRTAEAPKPAEQAAPPAAKPAEQAKSSPPKPTEQAAQPPAAKPAEQAKANPPKPAEQAARPPAAKPDEHAKQQASPPKPAEAARPPAPTTVARVPQQPERPTTEAKDAKPPSKAQDAKPPSKAHDPKQESDHQAQREATP
jgi:hypothetical protein